MKSKLVVCVYAWCFLALMLVTGSASAQTIAYRQANLTSDQANVANHVLPGFVNPWGIAFLSGQPFFISNTGSGNVTAQDATGASVAPASVVVGNPGGTGPDHPTGIVADQNNSFGGLSLVQPFVIVTEEGRIFQWGRDTHGNFLTAATLAFNNLPGSAVYKGVAILNSLQTQPALAVTNFQSGFVDTFIRGLARVALPGSFTDPNLPAGYAPFGIQVIGNRVFVTYAVQDAAKHDPVAGAGNGIVSIFDMDGNFVRRFATGGALNAPWGITQASASFGPLSNDILIGNIGDGVVNAFDPTTGNFVGKLVDGNLNDIVEAGLHGIAFREDGFGDANTLYFTAGPNSGRDGLFGAITTGLVSVTRAAAPSTTSDMSVRITATVAAGVNNPGNPTGTAVFQDGSTVLGAVELVNGAAALDAVLSGVGTHNITAAYSGDATFLASASTIPVNVTAAPNPDFAFGASPASATVMAGQSANFMLTIMPAGGFANSVAFACTPITGITCAFSPATVTPANGAASTMLTVSTSATVTRYGLLPMELIGPASLLFAIGLWSMLLWRGANLRYARPALLTATAVLAILGASLTLGGCGGYSSGSQANRGTASVTVMAQSGAISHATTVTVTVQ